MTGQDSEKEGAQNALDFALPLEIVMNLQMAANEMLRSKAETSIVQGTNKINTRIQGLVRQKFPVKHPTHSSFIPKGVQLGIRTGKK